MIQFTYKLKLKERVRANAVATSTTTGETRHCGWLACTLFPDCPSLARNPDDWVLLYSWSAR